MYKVKNLSLALTTVLLASCGELKPKPCSVEESEEGSLITCPDGTESLVKNGQGGVGAQGEKGEKGDTGAQGQGQNGDKGEKGDTGLPAVPGANWAMYSGNTRIGKILTNPLDAGFTTQVQNDPTIVEVGPQTFGYAYLDRVALGRFTEITRGCFYESGDCTGACLLPTYRFTVVDTSLAAPKIVYQHGDDTTSSLMVVDLSALTTKTVRSSLELAAYCAPQNSAMTVYVSAVYNIPNGVLYPIPSPNFKVE